MSDLPPLKAVRYGALDGSWDSEATVRVSRFLLGFDPDAQVGISNEQMMDVTTPVSKTWDPDNGVADIYVHSPQGVFRLSLGDWIIKMPNGSFMCVSWPEFNEKYAPQLIEHVGKTFEGELRSLLNRYSKENVSGTPDYILASYLGQSLALFNRTVSARATWRGESVGLPALSPNQ